jgi:hypothetical protein
MLVRIWEKGTLIPWWWECKLVQPLWKTVWRLFKNRSAIQFSNTTPRDTPKGMLSQLTTKALHTHVYCNIIHDSQAMETAKMLHY